MDRDTARQQIAELAQKYASQTDVYEQADYNEAQTKQDFINPLFKILGWDIDNEKGKIQYLREVILEDRVRVEGKVKHPDYAFRLGNTVLFYVEAKKPSVNILEDKESAFQLRHYGWNAKLSLCILTNFKDFAVYDCRVKPNFKDKASTARLTTFTYQDLIGEQKSFKDMRDGFDFLWDTFTQENISRGSFEKFIKDGGDRFKRGVLTVDDDFLLFLEDWRKKFAASIFRDNKNLTEENLNVAVQQILDRVVFPRFAEDRDIEVRGSLERAVKTQEAGGVYRNLYEMFEQADDRYNTGLFDMSRDEISRHLTVENKPLQDFVKGLYYPGPYNFRTIPVEILGSAYERFLGKTVRIISGRYVKVEEKPEVRKAGGVFYTPQYIVDYIVENTVGKLLENKTPKEVSKIKIVDPSCGSGSFLLGAYRFLLDWHQNYYAGHSPPSKGLRTDTLLPDGQLTIEEKKRILANNIFGVDIDMIAVEFAKLSLLLKCMEGESSATLQRLKIFHERMPPNIDSNIRVGNSLVDTDFYDMYSDSDSDTIIKPLNWQRAFPDVFKQGGFDCVIGNPPWEVTLGKDDKTKNRPTLEKFNLYCRNKYQSIQREVNLYKVFAERDILLVKKDGHVGLIMPTSLLNDLSNTKLRQFITSKFSSIEVNQFPERARVFKQITQDVCIYIFANDSTRQQFFLRTNLLKPDDLRKKSVSVSFGLLIKMGKIPMIKNKRELGILKKLNSYSTFHETGFIKFLEGEIHLTKFSEAICAKAKASTQRLIRGDAVRRYFFGESDKDSFINQKMVNALSSSPKFQDVGKQRLVYQQVVNAQKKRRLNFQLLTEKIYVANTCGYVLNTSNIYDIKFTDSFVLCGACNCAFCWCHG